MHNIPIAEEFRLDTFKKLKQSQEVKHLYEDDDINDIMIEFAKLHVQKVLEIAAEKAKIKQIPAGYYNAHIVDQDSILNVEYDYIKNIK